MIDDPSTATSAVPAQAPAPTFRAGVRRMDRLRQRFWATRVRLALLLRRDGGSSSRRRPR